MGISQSFKKKKKRISKNKAYLAKTAGGMKKSRQNKHERLNNKKMLKLLKSRHLLLDEKVLLNKILF